MLTKVKHPVVQDVLSVVAVALAVAAMTAAFYDSPDMWRSMALMVGAFALVVALRRVVVVLRGRRSPTLADRA